MSAPVRRSAPSVRQRSACECASAPIERRTHTRPHDTSSAPPAATIVEHHRTIHGTEIVDVACPHSTGRRPHRHTVAATTAATAWCSHGAGTYTIPQTGGGQ